MSCQRAQPVHPWPLRLALATGCGRVKRAEAFDRATLPTDQEAKPPSPSVAATRQHLLPFLRWPFLVFNIYHSQLTKQQFDKRHQGAIFDPGPSGQHAARRLEI
eukprot:6184347-Pleurochrysis_carterae.AAC.6